MNGDWTPADSFAFNRSARQSIFQQNSPQNRQKNRRAFSVSCWLDRVPVLQKTKLKAAALGRSSIVFHDANVRVLEGLEHWHHGKLLNCDPENFGKGNGIKNQNAKCKIKMQNQKSKCKIKNQKSKRANQKSKIKHQTSNIKHQNAYVSNQKSKIKNQNA
eukprot:COSAG01_NODE_5483_length_4230_cov_17.465505_4_plen_160_part_00